MGKLIFCYGAMGASKSAELLMWRYNYEQFGYSVLLMKPKIDNREKHLSDVSTFCKNDETLTKFV